MMDDQKLLQRFVRHGSQEAFAQLMRRHIRLVQATCRQVLQDNTLVEDAAQIVFLTLSRKAPTIMPNTPIVRWLQRAARLVARDIRRRELARTAREMPFPESSEDWRGLSPMTASLSYETETEMIWNVLTPAEAKAISLRFQEDLTLRETGNVLGISEDAVRMRVQRALKKIRAEREKDMSDTITLQSAIETLHRQLTRDNRGQFRPLITETCVREAIRTAKTAYLRHGLILGAEGYLQDVLFPLLEQIAEEGIWPSCAAFDPFYELTDEKGTTYTGLGLSLEVTTPDQPYPGFSLPILDVWYGRWV